MKINETAFKKLKEVTKEFEEDEQLIQMRGMNNFVAKEKDITLNENCINSIDYRSLSSSTPNSPPPLHPYFLN